MDQARTALKAHQAGYCAQMMIGQRLDDADGPANGKKALWLPRRRALVAAGVQGSLFSV
ncbi:MAG: hypothetical protein ACREFB_08875 [Stellaceae bacterium]